MPRRGLLAALPQEPGRRVAPVPTALLVLALLLSIGGGAPAAALATGPVVPNAGAAISETQVSSTGTGGAPVRERAFEPVVATHPTDPDRLAVVYQRHLAKSVVPALRISRDGGRSWADTRTRPWAGSGRSPGLHASIAWGPGPAPGSARLYWTDTTVGGRTGGHRVSIAWTDDEGRTWSRLYVEQRTPGWVGGFPDITVDRNPASPNYGVVYVAYNWLASSTLGPGLRLLASPDYGRSWLPLEIPAAPAPEGFPAAWRIDYRVRTGPDGAVHVAWFQANLRRWDSSRIYRTGGLSNVGRVGVSVARVMLNRSGRVFDLGRSVIAATLHRNVYTATHAAWPGTHDNLADPMWSLGLDVDPATGRILLAIGDVRVDGVPRGIVRVGHSDDGGTSWSWVTLPPLPAIGGRPQSSYRPNVVVADGVAFVGLRGIADAATGRSPLLHRPTVGVYHVRSLDGGVTFTAPAPLAEARWSAGALDPGTNGPGLRERADRSADGTVVYVYADGRLADSKPGARYGRGAVFVAQLRAPVVTAREPDRAPASRLTGPAGSPS